MPNRLSGFTGLSDKAADGIKTDCTLSGQNGSIFKIAGIAERAMQKHGLAGPAEKMKDLVFSSESYTKALSIIGEYVSIV